MMAHRSVHLVAIVVATMTMAACSGGEGPGTDVNGDTIVADAADDLHMMDTAAGDDGTDIGTDVSNPGDAGLDASDEGSDALPADTAQPDIQVVSTVGSYMYDFVESDTALSQRYVHNPIGTFRAIAANECGLVGLVFADRYDDGQGKLNNSLILSEVHLDSPPDMTTPPSRATLKTVSGTDAPTPMIASIAYEDCVPMVFLQNETGFEYTRVGGGAITWTAVDESSTYGEITSFGAMTGRDDKIHLVFRARPAGKTMQFVDAAWNGSTFDVTQVPAPDPAMISPIDVAINRDGHMVVAYLRAAADDSTEAWLAIHDGQSWDKELVTGINPSEFGIAFAIGSYESVGFAWVDAVSADDGLLLSASLKYTYRDLTGKFVTETVMLENDDYRGGGATRSTGALPRLTIDRGGNVHLLYSDIAVINSGDKQDISFGQARYAFKKGKTWHFRTVVSQRSPDDNGTPFMTYKDIAPNGPGTGVGIVALAVEDAWSGDTTMGLTGVSVATIQ